MSDLAVLCGVTLGTRITGADLTIAAGDCVVLVGKNGAGKSTLLSLLAGLLTPSSGVARLSGKSAADLGENERAGKVAWLPQRPHVEGTLTAREVVALARFRFAETVQDSAMRADEILELSGARHLAAKRLDGMSGGEAQRVLLAALRAQGAPLLLVDEPANHLDPLAQVQTYQALGQLWQKDGATLCLVTHDLRLCRLLGPAERVQVVGVAEGRTSWRLPLAHPDLPLELERLYGVPFLSALGAGGLGIAVERLASLDAEAP